LSCDPTSASPSIERMKGFHSGYASKVVHHLPHTLRRRGDLDLGAKLPHLTHSFSSRGAGARIAPGYKQRFINRWGRAK
jgi:hypothetical protein